MFNGVENMENMWSICAYLTQVECLMDAISPWATRKFAQMWRSSNEHTSFNDHYDEQVRSTTRGFGIVWRVFTHKWAQALFVLCSIAQFLRVCYNRFSWVCYNPSRAERFFDHTLLYGYELPLFFPLHIMIIVLYERDTLGVMISQSSPNLVIHH